MEDILNLDRQLTKRMPQHGCQVRNNLSLFAKRCTNTKLFTLAIQMNFFTQVHTKGTEVYIVVTLNGDIHFRITKNIKEYCEYFDQLSRLCVAFTIF